MVLAALFSARKPKTDPEEPPEVIKDPPSPDPAEESPRISNANAVYPFHDVKATSWPPPLSIDASVYTEARNLLAEETEITKEQSAISKNINSGRGDSIVDEGNGIEPCDWKTCPKDSSSLRTREKTTEKQDETKNKISHDRLKEMINVSIKEAMQIVAKQCRMKQDDAEEDPEKKPKQAKSICHKEGTSGRTKHERPRSAEEYFAARSRLFKNAQRCSRPQEKRNIPRACPRKLHEETKCHYKKVPCEDTRSKRHSKPASNGKTDNRRMTGNVNIYICSEATENAQPASKQKKPQPCAESSSETTTEPSKISSSKLVTRIRSKRRKRKEQESSDSPRSAEDSSEPSNPCSCDSKFSNIVADSASSVCAQETESTSTDCQCKDDETKSDQSICRSTYVICDKVQEPCSTIYPSEKSPISDSEEWSSKSNYSGETVLCDQSRKNDWPFGAKTSYKEYCLEDLKRDQDSGEDVCRMNDKKEVCKCGKGSFRSKRRLSRTVQREPWSTCSCIVEEEEEGVCVTAEDAPEITVCQQSTERGEGEITVCQRDSKKDQLEEDPDPRTARGRIVSEDEAKDSKEKQADVGLKVGQASVDGQKENGDAPASKKLLRPETLALRQLLQQSKPIAQTADQKSSVATPARKDHTGQLNRESPIAQAPETTVPPYLKKFNIREKDKFMKHLTSEQSRRDEEESGEAKVVEEAVEKKTEDNADGTDTEQRKSFPGRLRNSLFKTLRKVTGKERDKIADDSDHSNDKKTEISEQVVEDRSAEPENEAQGTRKEKRMSLVQRLDINKFFKKKEKPAINNSENTGENNDNSIVVDAVSKSNVNVELKEDAKKEENVEKVVVDVAEKDKSLLLTDIASKNLVSNPPSTNVEEAEETTSRELPKTSNSQGTIKKDSPPTVRRRSKDQKHTGNQEKKQPDAPKPKVHKEKAPKTRDTEECVTLKKDSATVCMQCTRQKLPTKEPRQPEASRCVSREMEPHTVCTNLIIPVCTNEENERVEDSRCNCCCLPSSPRCNRVGNYPRSCLKKERQFYRMDSQEIPGSCRDNRSWEECGCRRMVFCESCCRPRNECSCRPAVPCSTCCKPKLECICSAACTSSNHYRHLKSMVCLYCDSPRDSCACRSPTRKCSRCELAADLCCCDENRKTSRDGRQVCAAPDNDRAMYVTAWRPREDVRRYFSRNLEDLGRDPVNECRCHEKLKAQNSDDLPYQRLSCFSDVMDELQQKISESVCCTQCRKIPCCCSAKVDEGRGERKMKYCVSPKSRRKVVAVCTEKPRSKSPTVCKCDPQSRSDRQKKTVICCHCKSSPCRCKRTPKPRKPRMKCYYCKSSPCVCIAGRERGKPRPCRCADSPCRAKEKEITVCGKTSTKPKNNEEKVVCVR